MPPDRATLLAMATDPALFRRHLVIDADGQAVPFKPDDWQEQDFRSLDDGWRFAAGRWTGAAPPVMRGCSIRPRGHAKTMCQAVAATWGLVFAQRPIRGLACAGDRDQAALLRDAVAVLCRLNPWIGDVLDVQTWLVRNKRTGSTLEVLSSDTATSFGQLVDFIIADEITHWPEGSGEDFWHSLLSTAAKRATCLVAVIANAGFTESWSYKFCKAIQTDPAWHYSHLDGCQASWITPARLDEQRRLLPAAVFDRLWLNRWTSGAGDALTEADIAAAVTLEGPLAAPEPDHRYFAGLDLGITRDHSALVVVGRHHKTGRLRLAAVRSWVPPRGGKVDLEAVQEAVVQVHRTFRPVVYADVYQAELMGQQLKKKGVRLELVAFTGKSLMEMASSTIETFTGRSIDLFDDKALLADLRRLRLEEKAAGWRLSAERTKTGHADKATALMLAILAASKTRQAQFSFSIVAHGKQRAPEAVRQWGQRRRPMFYNRSRADD